MLEDENKIGETLTLKQELFCQYLTSDHEVFGNITLSYALAYNYDLDNMSKEREKVKVYPDDPEYSKIKSRSQSRDDDEEDLENEDFSADTDTPKKKPRYKIKELPSVYDLAYNTCSSNGHRLMRNAKVKARCEELLESYLENRKVDARLSRIIFQHRDDTDALNAIKEYNKLKQRIVEKREDKIDYTGSVIVLPVQRDDNGMAKIVEEKKEITTPEESPGQPVPEAGINQNINNGGIILPQIQ